MITNQELFDRTWDRYVVRGLKFGLKSNGNCAYRGPGGSKCAIGHEMTSEDYARLSQTDRDQSFSSLPTWFRDRFEDGTFVEKVQSAHDRAAIYMVSIDQSLRSLAREYGLEVPA